MNEDSVLTQAIIEVLEKRAEEKGDEFRLKGNRVQVRCFDPDRHKNGDAHPSSFYYLGKYIVCRVCGFKESEKKLAVRLGIGEVEGGLTLAALAHEKELADGLPPELGMADSIRARRAG